MASLLKKFIKQASGSGALSNTTAPPQDPHTPQHDLVEKLAREADSAGFRRTKSQNAVVILASRNHAAWLTDKAFMTNLLESFSPSSAKTGEETEEINVLAAAVDGLCPEAPVYPARHGFSVIHGPLDHLLPGLWSTAADTPASAKGQPQKAALTFRVNSSATRIGAYATTITLPLANTIFQNSQPFTLLASRWSRDAPGSPLAMSHMVTKPSQEVGCTGVDCTATMEEIFLHAITEPRAIVSGLGNIVRQIEVNGKPVPASQELETAVTKLFNRRRRIDGPQGLPKGPLGVWALVTPPESSMLNLGERKNPPDMGEIHKDASMMDEYKASQSLSRFRRRFIWGQRIFEVVSGGGGWGKKQGLLSLDTETKFSLTGEEDLEAFIRSFNSREGGDGDSTFCSGIVAPGSDIQFFVSATAQLPDKLQTTTLVSEVIHRGLDAFGVTPRIPDKAKVRLGESWNILPGNFGAVSAECMYMSDIDTAEQSHHVLSKMQTKITAPDSFVTTMPIPEDVLKRADGLIHR
ncbi:hypothetical protein ACHAQH_003918 [Verticillium albo-atrum]